jgi:hypothetical protein
MYCSSWRCRFRKTDIANVVWILLKHVLYAHGADERGRALFSKRISRGKLLDFFATQPSCTVRWRHVVRLAAATSYAKNTTFQLMKMSRKR